jgi:hypothetical protein
MSVARYYWFPSLPFTLMRAAAAAHLSPMLPLPNKRISFINIPRNFCANMD